MMCEHTTVQQKRVLKGKILLYKVFCCWSYLAATHLHTLQLYVLTANRMYKMIIGLNTYINLCIYIPYHTHKCELITAVLTFSMKKYVCNIHVLVKERSDNIKQCNNQYIVIFINKFGVTIMLWFFFRALKAGCKCPMLVCSGGSKFPMVKKVAFLGALHALYTVSCAMQFCNIGFVAEANSEINNNNPSRTYHWAYTCLAILPP